MQKVKRKISKIFPQLDWFGHPVTVNYRGSQHYQTSFGSIVTIFCGMLILIFTGIKLKDLVERDDAIFTKNTISVQLDDEFDKIYARDHRFDFAFSFVNLRTWEYVLPPDRLF
jgi:hypothetical protein